MATGQLSLWRTQVQDAVGAPIAQLSPTPPRNMCGKPRAAKGSPRAGSRLRKSSKSGKNGKAKVGEWRGLVKQMCDAAGGEAARAVAIAMGALDRRAFVPESVQPYAYLDAALPISLPDKSRQILSPSVQALCLSLMHGRLGSGTAALDIGCGEGYMTAAMAVTAGPGCRVTALELKEKLLNVATRNVGAVMPGWVAGGESAERPPIQFIQESWEGLSDLPGADEHVGAYDVVYMGYPPLRNGVPAALTALLAPGGRLVAHVVQGDLERLVVVDAQHSGAPADAWNLGTSSAFRSRTYSKIWPPGGKKGEAANSLQEPAHTRLPEMPASVLAAVERDIVPLTFSGPPACYETGIAALGKLAPPVFSPEPPARPHNVMHHRHIYRGSNHAAAPITLEEKHDSQVRDKHLLSRVAATVSAELGRVESSNRSSSRRAPPTAKAPPPEAATSAKNQLSGRADAILSPLPPGEDETDFIDLADADTVTGAKLISHVEELARCVHESNELAEQRLQEAEDARHEVAELQERLAAQAMDLEMRMQQQAAITPVVPPTPERIAEMRADLANEANAESPASTELFPSDGDGIAPAEHEELPAEDTISDVWMQRGIEPVLYESASEAQQVAARYTHSLISTAIDAVLGDSQGDQNLADRAAVASCAKQFLVGLMEAAWAKLRNQQDKDEGEVTTEDKEKSAETKAAAVEESEESEESEEGDEDTLGELAQLDLVSPVPRNVRRMSLADMRIEAGSPAAALALQKLRSQLSEVEIDEYRDFFELVDQDKSNSIDAKELKQLLTMMGMEAADDQIKAMIGEAILPSPKPGQVPPKIEMNFDEFLTLMATFVGPRGDQQEKELKEAFDVIDLDSGGTIDPEELAAAFDKYGEGMNDADIRKLIEQISTDDQGEIDFGSFCEMMLSPPKEPGDEPKILRRKARTTVRSLIMQRRMQAAFNAFNERYNFLRFSDARMISDRFDSGDDASERQQPAIVRFHETMNVQQALTTLLEKKIPYAPVFADEALAEDPIGVVFMIDLVSRMLDALKDAFKIQAVDPISIQMRLDRINSDASAFSNMQLSDVCDRKWHPVRRGFSVYDVGGMFAKGIRLVPFIGDDGDLDYLVSQASWIAAFDQAPEVRLAGVAHVTAAEMGAMMPLATATQLTPLLEAFQQLAHLPVQQGHRAVAVVNSVSGALIWSVSAETLAVCDTADGLGIALSKPCEALHLELIEQQPNHFATRPVTCLPETTLREMIHLVVETNATRLWVVDKDGRPIGAVSLTMLIKTIMRSE